MKPTTRPVVSYSRMSMLSRCGEQFRRRYVEHEVVPPDVSLAVGRAVDRAVSENLRSKMVGTGLKPAEEVADLARDAVEDEFRGEVVLSDEEASRGLRAVKGEAADKSIRLASCHARELAPAITPTAVQRWMAVDLSRLGYPAELVGIIDVQEGADRVRDTKTSAKSPVAGAADQSLQLTTYGLAARVLDGKAPTALGLDFLVDSKSGAKSVTQQTSRSVEDYRSLLRRVERYLEVVEKGAFQPTNPDNWWCSTRFCGYATTCPFYRRPVSVPVDLVPALQASLTGE
jgi:hypothetical protein